MKLLSLVLVMIAALGLLTYTNPTMDEYRDFVRKSVVEGVRKEKPDPLAQLFSPSWARLPAPSLPPRPCGMTTSFSASTRWSSARSGSRRSAC